MNRTRSAERTEPTRASGGFSLIEFVCVMGLVALIVAMGLFVFRKTREDALCTRARADIEKIHFALQDYKLKTGAYPALPAGTNTVAVAEIPAPAFTNGFRATYGVSARLTDPWDRPYGYAFDRAASELCRVFSAGPDGTPGTEDDIEVCQ